LGFVVLFLVYGGDGSVRSFVVEVCGFVSSVMLQVHCLCFLACDFYLVCLWISFVLVVCSFGF